MADFPAPTRLQLVLVAQRIHGLPEPQVLVGLQLAIAAEGFQRHRFPRHIITLDQRQHARRQYEKAAIDEAAIAARFFGETRHHVALAPQRAVASRGLHRGHRGRLAVAAVEGDQGADIDVRHAIAIGEAEGLFFLDVVRHALETAARHGGLAGVHQGHAPGFGLALVHFHAVVGHVEGHVRHVQEVVGEVLIDHVALVAAADHEVVDAVRGIDLHDVPQNGLPADLDHRLGTHRAFFADAGAEAARKNDRLHGENGPQCKNAAGIFA